MTKETALRPFTLAHPV